MQQASMAEIVLFLTLAINLGALVWGAATIAAAVKQLKESLNQMSVVIHGHGSTLNQHETRITVLEKV